MHPADEGRMGQGSGDNHSAARRGLARRIDYPDRDNGTPAPALKGDAKRITRPSISSTQISSIQSTAHEALMRPRDCSPEISLHHANAETGPK